MDFIGVLEAIKRDADTVMGITGGWGGAAHSSRASVVDQRTSGLLQGCGEHDRAYVSMCLHVLFTCGRAVRLLVPLALGLEGVSP